MAWENVKPCSINIGRTLIPLITVLEFVIEFLSLWSLFKSSEERTVSLKVGKEGVMALGKLRVL